MRKIREVLRLKHEIGLGDRPIAKSVGISRSSVGEYLKRAEKEGVTWEVAQGLSDTELETRLFRHVGRNEPRARAPIDLQWVDMELRRKGVTLQQLWVEYQEGVASEPSDKKPYQYSQFCDLFSEHRAKLGLVMRQEHRAGEKAFIDYSGKKPHIIDPRTGEKIEVELFVMVLGASNYTYVEATLTQKLEDFIGATVRGLEFFGAVPDILVPDQLRSAVKKPDRYEPELNATYAEMGQHYGTAIVPARPRKPRDKAKVEVGVQVVQRWILACLRHRQFFSLQELNAAIRELLIKLNERPFKKLAGCRRSLFEAIDRPAMRPLPPRRYEVGRWKMGVGVNVDYHIEYDRRFYSVPCELVQAKVDVRATSNVVEVFRNTVRITSHERCHGPDGTAVTKPEHMPRSHREYGAWPSERLVGWAAKTGPETAEVAAAILSRGPHVKSGRRACLGLLRLGEKYGEGRLEAACARALRIKNPTRKSVESILRSGLDGADMPREVKTPRIEHENIRGGDYFDRQETAIQTMERDEFEAHYLEEERLAIMNEPVTGRALSEGSIPEDLRAAPVAPAMPESLARSRATWAPPIRREKGERRSSPAMASVLGVGPGSHPYHAWVTSSRKH